MDSEAAFVERAKQVHISEGHIEKLRAKKLNTYGAFAFISSFQPGSADERPFVRALASALDETEADLSDAVLASFRRLYYECHTVTLGDLRARIERKDDDAPKRIPMAERSERLAQLKSELSGITIDIQLEPAHRLMDTVMQQIEDNCISYIPLKDCLSRESELLSHKHETTIDFSHDGTMKLSKRQREIKADISGDLKVKMAMQRRALAYHMAGACNYNVLDGIIARMFSLLTKEPVAGFRAVTLQQLTMAEREMWMMASQSTRGQLVATSGKPLEKALVQLQDAPEVDFACNSEQLVFAEIFAGTAQLSSECKSAGFATLAIDKTTERKPKVALTLMDLTEENGIQRVLELASTANIGAAHLAPACGTSSKAREKPLPAHMRHIRSDPLRSDSELLGLSSLSAVDRERVQSANKTYALTLLLVTILIFRGCVVSVENQTPVIIFSDGAWEPDAEFPAGAGLVLIDPVTGRRLVSEVEVPSQLIKHWKHCGKKQLITELELLPIAVGLSGYADYVKGRRVLWFIDNNSVKDMIVKGSTATPSLFCLLAECYRLAGNLQILWWVSRVPSKSNIADLPSRRDAAAAAKLIKGQVTSPLKCSSQLVQASLSVESFVDYMEHITAACKSEKATV
eukprot:symbB.v1.2.041655.t1/scaffold8457.1/size11431/1